MTSNISKSGEGARGKMRCTVRAGRDCIPVKGHRKAYCARVANGTCQFHARPHAATAPEGA